MLEQMQVAVLGGGIAGITLAAELSRDPSLSIALIENYCQLGGLMRSITIDARTYDIGSFTFSNTHDLFRLFPDLLPYFPRVPIRAVSVRVPASLDYYPATLSGYARDFGHIELYKALGSIVVAKLKYRNPATLSDWIKYYLGDRFYERTGLRNYVERFHCEEIGNVDLEFARQRLQDVEQRCALRRAVPAAMRKFVREVSPSAAKASPYTQLVRPQQGFDFVFERIRKNLEARGVSVLTGSDMHNIRRDGSGFRIDCTRGSERFDRVISTIPVSVAARLAGVAGGEACEYVNLFSLFYRFTGTVCGDWNHLYNFTNHGKWKRVTLFSRIYDKATDHYFTVEGTCRTSGSQTSLLSRIEDFEKHIRTLGIFVGKLQLQGQTMTEYAYPMYARGNNERIGALKAALSREGIEYVGRQAGFQYLNSAVVARQALALARG